MKNSKKTIFLIVPNCIGGYGGIAEYNRNVLKALDDTNEYFIHIFSRNGCTNKIVSDNYVHYQSVQNKYIFSIKVLLWLLVLKPSILFNGHLFTTNFVFYLSKIYNSKFINQFHGTEVWGKKLNKRTLNILNKSNLNLSVSNFTRDDLKKNNKLNSVVLPNTFNTNLKPLDILKVRKKLGFNSNEKIIITVGRLDSRRGGYKGHDYILEALPVLIDHYKGNVRYLIIGKGEDVVRLKDKVNRLKLNKFVNFLGFVPEEKLNLYYSASNLFALLSDGEGFGIVYLEAMACGVPCIGLNVGGVPDVLRYSYTTLLDTSKNSLNKELFKLLSMPVDRGEIFQNVNKDFGFSSFKIKLQSLLKVYV